MTDAKSKRTSVFISYSHQDHPYLERLKRFLNPHVRDETIPLWVDTQIQPGDLWHDEIRRGLAAARVAILLVSVDFLDSEFIVAKSCPPCSKRPKKRAR